MRVLAPKTSELSLDVKDWRVLKELVSNIRQPVSQIAKKIRLSRQAVEYRIKLFKENKLITGSRTIINIGKLGYKSYHVFIEVHTPEQESELTKRAKEAKFVNAIISYSGKFNLEISIMARDDEQFLKLYEILVKGLRIRDDQILILLKNVAALVLPEKYFPELKKLEKGKLEEISLRKRAIKHDIDDVDLKLLFELSRDARVSNLSLAKKLDVSKDTVKYRIQNLEKSKYILNYRPVINYSVLGFSINSVLIKLNSDPKTSKEFEGFLNANGSVLWATKTLGYYDYIIYVITRDLDEFHDFINSIKKTFTDLIMTYEILFAFEELKYNFMAKSLLS